MTLRTGTRLSGLRKELDKLTVLRESSVTRLGVLQKNSEELAYELDLNSKCSEIFKNMLEKAIEVNVSSISELVTSGLKHIIEDQALTFQIKQEHKNNRIAMKFTVEQDGVEGDPLSSFGGGAAVVISLILRIAIMRRMGLGNLLILDESMVALANAYVPKAASFMRELSEKTGIHILMVTHNPEFIANSHTAYEGSKVDSLSLIKVEVGNEKSI